MLEDFRSHRGIAPLTTGFDYPVFLETISLLQFRHPKARGVQSTKSVGQALRVSLVKPGAYLSASYRTIQRLFNTPLNWLQLNWLLIRHHLWDGGAIAPFPEFRLLRNWIL